MARPISLVRPAVLAWLAVLSVWLASTADTTDISLALRKRLESTIGTGIIVIRAPWIIHWQLWPKTETRTRQNQPPDRHMRELRCFRRRIRDRGKDRFGGPF